MKKWIIYLSSILIAILSLACYLDQRVNKAIEINNDKILQDELNAQQEAHDRLKSKADSALAYCRQKGFSTDYCFLIDFSIHSGKYRFFIWDFNKRDVRMSGLCAHGYGKGSTQSKPVFSNIEGSLCSSLGHYKTGARGYSNWGTNVSYKLHGLDVTNSNAFVRLVTLHAHTPIPAYEIYPQHLPLGYSQGCTVISNALMTEIDTVLKASRKPLLLWIYN